MRTAAPFAPVEQLVSEEPGHRLERGLAQPLALGEQPLLEGRFRHGEPGEEIALVQPDRALEIGEVAWGRLLHERRDVDGDRRRVERHRARLQAKPGRTGGDQDLAKREERLAQTTPRLWFAHPAPEQRGKLVTGVGPARRTGEVGQQRLSLPGRQSHDRPGGQLRVKAAEERESEPGQSRLRASFNTAETNLERRP